MKELSKIDINTNEILRDIENFLRDNIKFILENKFKENWLNKLGVTNERMEIWGKRKDEEKVRMNGKEIEGRLLYYSDFYDLKNIIDKNWNIFKEVFKNKQQIDYQLNLLETFRNPNAHNRDLLNHQKHLLIGIVGEIKTDMLKFRGDIENVNTFFPKVDNININGVNFNYSAIELKKAFRKGDVLDITIYASKPPEQEVYYAIWRYGVECDWKKDNNFLIKIDEEDLIGENTLMIIGKSNQGFHKMNTEPQCDIRCCISYTILP